MGFSHLYIYIISCTITLLYYHIIHSKFQVWLWGPLFFAPACECAPPGLRQVCDVSSMAAVRAFAAAYVTSGQPLHILVNNAGAMVHTRQHTAEGVERNFATNTLGTWALTELLLPALEKSAPARVITVSTGGVLSECLEVDDLEWGKGARFDGTRQYARNKRQQVALGERWMEVRARQATAGLHRPCRARVLGETFGSFEICISASRLDRNSDS
jgi:hypothetical protein